MLARVRGLLIGSAPRRGRGTGTADADAGGGLGGVGLGGGADRTGGHVCLDVLDAAADQASDLDELGAALLDAHLAEALGLESEDGREVVGGQEVVHGVMLRSGVWGNAESPPP